jgi:hypothetical protein
MVPGSVKFGSIARRVARCANKLCPQRGGADLSCAIVAPPGNATMTRGTRRRRRVRPGGVRRPPQGMDPQRIPKTPATRWLQPPGQDAVLFRFFCQPKTSFQLVETSDYCKFCTERFYFLDPTTDRDARVSNREMKPTKKGARNCEHTVCHTWWRSAARRSLSPKMRRVGPGFQRIHGEVYAGSGAGLANHPSHRGTARRPNLVGIQARIRQHVFLHAAGAAGR